MRIVRLKKDRSWLCALNLQHAEGIADLETPGILELRRDASGEVKVTTNRGLAFQAAWLGGSLRKVEVWDIQGGWVDAGKGEGDFSLPGSLVREWADRNERSLVSFRISV